MSRYKKITLSLIDEGRFEKEIDDAVQKAAAGLLKYRKRHGKELTRGTKAEVMVKIVIAADKQNDEAFFIKGTIQEKIPSRPPVVNMAIADEEQDGEEELFMRASGGTEDTPRQGVLSTRDGETINVVTGEVIDRKGRAAGE